jgi:outer membrane protein OmpA-like peptidoglycan-associated protein
MIGVRKYIGVAVALVALSGCAQLERGLSDMATGFEHFGEDVARVVSGEDVAKTSSAMEEAADFSQYRTDAVTQPSLAPTAYSGETYSDMAYQRTHGSVEVYPVGGALPSMAPTQHQGYSVPRPGQNTGATYFSRDESITIYPLDGAYRPQAYPQANDNRFQPVMQHATLYGEGPKTITHSRGDMAGGDIHPAIARPGTVVIQFPHDQTSLTSAARAQVREIAERYKREGRYADIAIEGHASRRAVGTAEQRHATNLKVSMERAYNVAKALIAAGVPASKVETASFGDSRPAGTEAQSRRVEVFTK